MGNYFRRSKTNGISPFYPQYYQGLWYEVARYPNFFEKNCTRATAEYILKDGYIEVTNKCYSDKKELEIIKGKARLTDISGELLVKFDKRFTPEGSYIVIWTDYTQFAFVISDFPRYYWVLSRSPYVSRDYIVQKTLEFGYDPSQLIFPDVSQI